MWYHFIAFGSGGTPNLALALHQKGHKVSGSDEIFYEPSKTSLQKHDLLPRELGWFPEKITSQLDAVVLGKRTKSNNPELLKAKELGIKVFSYPEFLYELSKNKTRVVIGGSHGKSTISLMILHVLQYHHKEVDYVLNDKLQFSEENDFIILEGDEYLHNPIDRQAEILMYKPNIALLSEVSWDGNTIFPTYEEYLEQFRIFIDSIVKGGILVYNEEDEALKKLSEETKNTIRKHPYNTPDHKIEGETTFLETPEGDMPLEITGKHNVNHIAGAKWICQHMGIDEDDFYEAISSFKILNSKN